MEDTLHIRKYVMRRVYTTYILRQLRKPFAIKAYVLLAAFLILARVVSIGNVLINMPHTFDFGALYSFFSTAFLHTEIVPQAMIAVLCVTVFLLAKDAITRKGDFFPALRPVHS